MRVQACQKAVTTRLGGGLLRDVRAVNNTKECKTAITEDQALAELAKFTGPGTSRCREDDGYGYSDNYRRCYSVGPVEVSIEKPNWLQHVGIKISDFFSALFD